MCGICGMLRLDGEPADEQIVVAMTETLVHRGPDQGRVLVDGPCALGNRRLAILDLSPAGALPMRTADGALAVAYNGEIYNYPELRRSLKAAGVNFRSGSDAEALLELYRREGPGALEHLRGMFAFALWDGPGGDCCWPATGWVKSRCTTTPMSASWSSPARSRRYWLIPLCRANRPSTIRVCWRYTWATATCPPR